jgi:hypothetical protein
MSTRGSNSSRKIRATDIRIDATNRPGWDTCHGRTPGIGERVYCTQGMAQVVRVLGRTGDGSRLLELRLEETQAPPFFVAASNVLVDPGD